MPTQEVLKQLFVALTVVYRRVKSHVPLKIKPKRIGTFES